MSLCLLAESSLLPRCWETTGSNASFLELNLLKCKNQGVEDSEESYKETGRSIEIMCLRSSAQR